LAETPSEIIGVLAEVAGAMLVAATVRALVERPDWQNRYEIAVGANQPASQVADLLETMVNRGLVHAMGDPGHPNERTYRLDEAVLAEA